MRAFVDPDLCIGCTLPKSFYYFTAHEHLPRPAPSAPSAWRRAESSPKITGKQLPPGDFLWAGFVLYYKV